MPVINVDEGKKMIDVGEMVRDYESECDAPICGTEDSKPKKMKKSYPTVYLYEIPDELFSAFSVGSEYELTVKVKIKEITERITDSEQDGKKERRTVDLELREISKP